MDSMLKFCHETKMGYIALTDDGRTFGYKGPMLSLSWGIYSCQVCKKKKKKKEVLNHDSKTYSPIFRSLNAT